MIHLWPPASGRCATLDPNCRLCPLCEHRTQIVMGEGSRHASLILLGEGPGAEEDRQGRPFVGRAGRLLDELLVAAGGARETVFITNVVRCRPPRNRRPKRAEIVACRGNLADEVAPLPFQVVCTLGQVAGKEVAGEEVKLAARSGRPRRVRWLDRDVWWVPSYHPAAALRNPRFRKKVQAALSKAVKLAQGP